MKSERRPLQHPASRWSGPVLCDVESRSRANLRKCGGRRYWDDPSSGAICAVLYHPASGEVSHWVPGMPPPQLERAVAHNARMFDQFAAARSGWRVRRWDDSAQAARRAGLPGSLDALAQKWLGRGKDKAGNRFTLSLSRPSRAKARKGQLPEITAAALERVLQYCANDVEVMADGWGRLEPWFQIDADAAEVDTAINERGIQFDMDLVEALQRECDRYQSSEVRAAARALGVTEAECKRMARSPAVFAELTGLPNAQKATVDEYLEGLDESVDAHPLVHARRALANIVAGKLEAARNRVSDDGRLRDSFMYYGGHTGRWSAKGVQLQNLTRVEWHDQDSLADWLLAGGGLSEFKAVFDGKELSFQQKLAAGMRGCITAKPGHVLAVLDYSLIEARVNAWAAGDRRALDVFRAYDAGKGPDPYCAMASKIFGYTVEKKTHPQQRQVGKGAVLGCFAADTLVLTRRGAIPIVDVRPSDMVWDGTEWVAHSGVIDQGRRETIELLGVNVTPEHSVWCGSTWESADTLARRAKLRCLALETASAGCQSPAFAAGCGAEFTTLLCAVTAAPLNTSLPSVILCAGKARGAIAARNKHLRGRASVGCATLRFCQTTRTEKGYSTGFRRSSSGATTPHASSSATTVGAAYGSGQSGARIERGFCAISLSSTGGINRNSSSTGPTTTEGTDPVTCGSSQPKPTLETGGRSAPCKPESTNSRRVYDIANAGHRNRFTIVTAAGPLIVHNCGFQMGAAKFAATCEKQGIDLAAAGVEAEAVVKAWRALHKPIVQSWYAMQDAFAGACQGRDVHVGPFVFAPIGNAVACVLPSGRPIVYNDARAKRVHRQGPHGTYETWELSYFGQKKNVWTQVHAYGGLLCENAVQATARDLLADTLVRAEADGLDPVQHTHDEAGCEVPESAGKEGLEWLRRIMQTPPDWAKGLPVVADGFVAKRYRK